MVFRRPGVLSCGWPLNVLWQPTPLKLDRQLLRTAYGEVSLSSAGSDQGLEASLGLFGSISTKFVCKQSWETPEDADNNADVDRNYPTHDERTHVIRTQDDRQVVMLNLITPGELQWCITWWYRNPCSTLFIVFVANLLQILVWGEARQSWCVWRKLKRYNDSSIQGLFFGWEVR